MFRGLRNAQFGPAVATMAIPAGQMNNNLLPRQRHFSTVSSEISLEKSLKMGLKRPVLDTGINNNPGKSLYEILKSDKVTIRVKFELI